MDMARIDAVVPRDTTEIWEVGNRGNTPHKFVVVPPGERPGHPPAHHHDPEGNTP
jgi:hypothetical protein